VDNLIKLTFYIEHFAINLFRIL